MFMWWEIDAHPMCSLDFPISGCCRSCSDDPVTKSPACFNEILQYFVERQTSLSYCWQYLLMHHTWYSGRSRKLFSYWGYIGRESLTGVLGAFL